MQMVCNLREFKEFIDNEMIVILGQMDSPTEIFEHVFLVRIQEPRCLIVSSTLIARLFLKGAYYVFLCFLIYL